MTIIAILLHWHLIYKFKILQYFFSVVKMYLLKEMIFLRVIFYVSANLTSTLEHDQTFRHKSLMLCMENIADEYYKHKSIISVLESRIKYNNADNKLKFLNILVGNMFSKMKWSILIKNLSNTTDVAYNKNDQTIQRTNIYIINMNKMHELISALSLLQDKTWNPHAKFILYSTGVYANLPSIIENLIEQFWKLKVLNVILIFPSKNIESFNIYTWFPYSNGNCGTNFTNSVIINECKNGIFARNTKIFVDKIPKNLNKCPIRVRTVIWPPYVVPPETRIRNKNNVNFTDGLEIVLLNNIANIANFSVIYSVSNKSLDWGALDYMGETRGLFKTLSAEEVDMGISSLAATPIRYMNLDPSTPYTFESMTWCVPKANLKPEWLSIYQSYSLNTWLLIFAVYITESVFFYILSYNKDVKIFNTLQDSFLNTFSILASVSVWKKPSNCIIRMLFVLWAVFSLHFDALYQSNLIKFIVNPALEKQITRFDELVNDNIPMGSFYIWREYFNNTDTMNSLEFKMKQKWIDCHDIDTCLSHVAYAKNYSIAIPKLYVSYAAKKFLNNRKEFAIYWFRNDYISYPVQMYAYRGFPFIHRINSIIGTIFQSGFLSKWEQDLKKLIKEKEINLTEIKSEDVNIPDILSLKALQGAFIIYLFGIICSIFVFIIELISFRCKRYTFVN